jgi:serine/threonine protein kinase
MLDLMPGSVERQGLRRHIDSLKTATVEELVESARLAGLLTALQARHLVEGRGRFLFITHRYVLQDLLGQGGMGTVYRAWDRKARRHVALKVLCVPSPTEALRRRFAREARLHGRVGTHPHVVFLFDSGKSAGQAFLVLELIDGENLFRVVKRSGPLPWPLACRLARDLCRGLQHLAQQGVVHRDVKPGNVVLGHDGTVRLLDLGLSLDLRPSAEEPLTPAGVVMGTPGYIAPEAFADVHDVDSRADVFSAGSVLYYLGTGKQPFGDALPSEVLLKNMAASLPSLAGIPRPVRTILRRALARHPGRRFASPGQMAEALDRYCAARDRAARRRKRSRRSAGTQRAAWVAVLCLLAALAAVMIGLGAALLAWRL